MFKIKIILAILSLVSVNCFSQNSSGTSDSFLFKGQLSGVAHYNIDNDLPIWLGGRYIPQLNYNINLEDRGLIDFEVSANILGNTGLKPFSNSEFDGRIKPYRAWVRYSTKQLELRLGLQKINFGSASIFRPLMWFDQVDPRDPLRLTDGVWGILGRYYFLNNSNLWLWGLLGNKNTRGWEVAATAKNKLEFGGRFQTPIPKGEAGLSYHRRTTDTYGVNDDIPSFREVVENRIGFDAKLNLAVGLWLEGSWVTNDKNLGMYSNQEILNAGIDYTFGVGGGVYVVFEQLIAAYDKHAFDFSNTINFSLLSVSTPLGLFDNLGAIFYYNWETNSFYNFISWQKQFDSITLHTIAYLNPENYQIPTQGGSTALYGGFGVQFIFVYNH